MAVDSIYKERIDTFYGGISGDIRLQTPEKFRLSSHLDIWSNPKRMTPYRAMSNNGDLTFDIVLFVYANSNLFGLGATADGGSIPKIYDKGGDPINALWAASTSGAAGSGVRGLKTFLEFHGYLYGGLGTGIFSYGDVTGSPSFTASAYPVGVTASAQGIVTSDDKLLIPCDTVVAMKDGAGSGPTNAWTTPITVPSNYTIFDLCEHGDLVALALGNDNEVGNSRVYLWNKLDPDPVDTIDWGEGTLQILDNIDGELIGISFVGSGTYGIRSKLVFKRWAGGPKATTFLEVQSDDQSCTIYGNHTKFREGNKIVFGLKIKIDGVTYNQLFAIGRKTTDFPLGASFDRLVNNDTAITTIQGAYRLGDYVFVAYDGAGAVNRTATTAAYSNTTPTYFSQRIDGSRLAPDLARKPKGLVMAGAMFVPLTSGQSVSLYYRKDAESSWTLIRTHSTVGALEFEAGIDNSGADFGNFTELEFKATAAGGAEITAFVYAFKELSGDVAP